MISGVILCHSTFGDKNTDLNELSCYQKTKKKEREKLNGEHKLIRDNIRPFENSCARASVLDMPKSRTMAGKLS